jgi:hydrogenase-4 membrane subunit HyfE
VHPVAWLLESALAEVRASRREQRLPVSNWSSVVVTLIVAADAACGTMRRSRARSGSNAHRIVVALRGVREQTVIDPP